MASIKPITKLSKIILSAIKYAKENSVKYVTLEFLLFMFLKDNEVRLFLRNKDIDYDKLMEELEVFINTFPMLEHFEHSDDKVELTDHIYAFEANFFLCNRCSEDGYVNESNRDLFFITNMLSSFLLMKETFSQSILIEYGVTLEMLAEVFRDNSSQDLSELILNNMRETTLGLNSQRIPNTSNNSAFLQKYTDDFYNIVNDDSYMPIIGRENDIELIHQIMNRHDKPNVIIVGDSGIGKTKIVEGVAKYYFSKHPDWKFLRLNNSEFLSNIVLKGDLEARVKNLYQSLKEEGMVVLFIDDMQQVCSGTDQTNQLDITPLLKPILNANNIKVIGTITFEDYRRCIEKDTSIAKRFYKLNIEEPSKEETYHILDSVKDYYEKVHHVKYGEGVLETIIDCSEKYFTLRKFPEKAIDILDMVGAMNLTKSKVDVTIDDVFKSVSVLCGIPLNNISQTEEEIYQHLEENIKKEIVGQDEAVERVSEAVIISRSGLRESNKTACTLMFAGESGVGKTELCKVLSKLMNIPLVRFDMSEYIEDHSVSKLLGAPPGYKGFSDGKSGNGLLINAVDEHPHCILLLDEIEKANPRVHNLLLQVMDDGKITSSQGKTVSFEHVYLIMTSNAGSYNTHKTRIGFGNNDDETPSDEDFNSRFLPEFRNRIDSTIKFNSLPEEVMKKICIKFLDELKEVLFKKGITLQYNDKIVEYIVNKVDGKGNGARPMKHIITNEIKNRIAKDIVFGKCKKGSKIKLVINDEEIGVKL